MTLATNSSAASQYQQIGTETKVAEASPHRLIQLMMEGVLARIAVARGQMERGEIAAKGKSVGDAIGLINGLQASLNHKADTRMAENFDALYGYMMRRLLEANLNDEVSVLDEVSGLMRELKEAWDAIADQAGDAPVQA